MENVIIKFVADTDGLQPAIKQLEAIGKITAEDAARIQKLNDEQREYIQTVNQTTTAFGELSAEAKDITAVINAQVLQGVADAMAEMGDEAQKGATKFKSLKAELRELKAQIAKGDMGAKELREATKRAAELEDQIGDVSEKVKALASDTKYIDSAVTAMRGLAAAGAVTQGAMALLGDENEDLQKTMMKVQAATAVLMGVQEMATIVTGQSALKTLFLDTAQKAAAVSSKALGVTITTSMAAATMGLSLVIGAIAALVVSMDDASEEAEAKAKEAQEKEKEIRKKNEDEARKRAISQYKAEDELILSRLKRKEKTLANEIEYETMAARLRIKALRDSYLEDEINAHEMVMRKHDIEEQLQYDIQQIRKRYAEKERQAEDKRLAEMRRKREELTKDFEMMPRLKPLEVKFDLKKSPMPNIEERMSSFMQAQLNASKEFNMKHEDLMAEFYASGIEKFEEFLQAKRDAEKAHEEKRVRQMQQAEAAVQIANVGFDVFKEMNQRKLDEELNAMNILREQALANVNLTEAQRAQIEERFRAQESNIKRRQFQAQKAADVIQATINTALAISRALPNIPLAAAAGVAGAAQVAIIASQPIPQFAKGTEQFITDGTGTSDSGLAWLSNGERVVPASINSEYWGALSAIHNRKVSPRLANSVIEELSRGGSDAIGFDYDRLGRVIGGGKGSSKVVINLDERGFTKHVMRENSRVTYLNKKLRLTA